MCTGKREHDQNHGHDFTLPANEREFFFNKRKRKAHSKKHETKQKRWEQSNQLHEHAALYSQATKASDHYMSH